MTRSADAAQVKPSIYIWYHRKAPIIQNNYLKPVQVGAALAKTDLALIPDNLLKSNQDSQISNRNKTYAELTGLYWSWKNDHESTHVGSFHYRRLMSLAEIPYPANEHNTTSLPFFLIDNLGHYGLDERSIEEACSKYDLIIPKPTDVRAEGATSIRDQYSRHHTLKWFDRMLEVAAELYPQYIEQIKKFPNEQQTYFFNMLIARKDIYNQACSFVFSILEKLAEDVDESLLLAKDQRLFGFMGERVFSLYFKILLEKNKDIRIKEVPCINIPEDKLVRVAQKAVSSKPVIPVVLAADDGYAPMLGITINSLLSRITDKYHYDIIVLDSGLSQKRKLQISTTVQNSAAVKSRSVSVDVRFVTLPAFSLGASQFYRSQWSFATYNRLLLAEILPYDKIVYLDCDLVVLDDVAKLYSSPLNDKYLAAVPDFFVTGEFRKGVVHDLGGYRSTLKEYYSKLLRKELSDSETFYQAGVLLFNLRALREDQTTRAFLKVFYENNPQFGVDQDILNIVCYGKIQNLDYRWNVVNHPEGYLNSIADVLSPAEKQKIQLSRDDAACLHFTGAWLAKPFNSLVDFTQFSEIFWQEARPTCWYEEVLSRAISSDLGRVSGNINGHLSHEMHRIGELSIRRTVKRNLSHTFQKCNNMLPKQLREALKLVPKLQALYRRVAT